MTINGKKLSRDEIIFLAASKKVEIKKVNVSIKLEVECPNCKTLDETYLRKRGYHECYWCGEKLLYPLEEIKKETINNVDKMLTDLKSSTKT